MCIAAIVAGILLVRRLKRRDSGGYHRRFVNGAPPRDEAFPFAATLYLGDGSSGSHAYHHHSTDCAHASDGGVGCSDGGGGGNGN